MLGDTIINAVTGNLSNFWVAHPKSQQLLTVKLFNDLHKKDKSKDKSESSNTMWAIALYTDNDSIWIDLPSKDRKSLIGELIKVKWDLYTEYIKIYSELCLSQAERSLVAWKNKLQERDEFIADTPYDIENADRLDKILANTDKLYKQLKAIEAELSKEQGIQNKGGSEASMSDTGEI